MDDYSRLKKGFLMTSKKQQRAKSRRKIATQRLKLTQGEERLLLEEFGNYSRGYSIPCRFCGWNSSDHEWEEEGCQMFSGKRKRPPTEGSSVREKGYRATLQECIQHLGYIPKNIRQWCRADREARREEDEVGILGIDL